MTKNHLYQKAKRRHFSVSKKEEIIEYYLSHNHTKQYVWHKFTGDAHEHGQILHWMRQLGYRNESEVKKSYLVPMEDPSTSPSANISSPLDAETVAQQASRIKELERLLAASERKSQEAKIKAEAYLEVILLAESTLQIPIRKKSDTKSSKL